MSQIGRRVRPLDWRAQTSGAFAYTDDLRWPGLLHAAVLRSPYPHARILSLDLAPALAIPGVRAVVSAADFPAGVRYLHEGAADRPPLADRVARFIGQEIAAVAADTAEAAEAALAAIQVRYGPLAGPLDLDAALAPGAPRLHDRPGVGPNVSYGFRRLWGDIDRGVAAGPLKAEGRFWFPPQHHACMEPSIVVAHWAEAEARLHLWCPTGAPYYVVRETAHVLGLAEDQVVCHEVGVGGSFGARTKVCDYEAIAGALSRKAGAPVRLALTRAADFATTKSRHGFRLDLTLHGDMAGRLTAIAGDIAVDNGAYNHSGASVTSAGVKGLGMLYRPDGLDVRARLVDTAKRPGGQFRGYGTTQTSFALECLVDELAEAAGRDPLDYRIANANAAGEVTLVGARIGSCGLEACLKAAGEAIGWTGASPHAGEGVGFASAVHVSGSHVGPGADMSEGAVDLFADGRIRVRCGSGDAGTGQKTILAQIAAEALGVEAEAVSVLSIESDATPFDMGSWSSRGTHYTGHATRLAANAAAARLAELAAERFGWNAVAFRDGRAFPEPAAPGEPGVAIAALVAAAPDAVDGVLSFERTYVEAQVEAADRATGLGNVSASYNFAAHAARVRVDRRTGRVTVLDYVAAHDVGAAINPTLVEGQVVGGTAMGLGAALSEEVVYEQGRVVNPAFISYGVPRAADLPRIRPILVGEPDPNGPHGAKAVGETGINPPTAAIANAIYDAVGVRLRAPPFTPDKVLDALARARGGRRRPALLLRPGRWWIALVRWAYPHGLFRALHARVVGRYPPSPPTPLKAVARPWHGEVLRLTLASGYAPLGGGTDLHPRRRQGLPVPERLANVAAVEALRRVEPMADGGWSLGAGATLTDLAAAARGALPALAEAIDQIASLQIRNVATLGGSLLQANRCWFLRNGFDCYKRRGGLAPCYAILGDHRFHHAAIDGHRCQSVTPSDLASVFVGLDAVAVVEPAQGSGARRIPFGQLYTGPGETVLGPGDLLTKVEVPAAPPGLRTAYAKLNLWEGDFALVSVMLAARVDGQGCWRDLRIVLGGIAPTPFRAARTERALEGEAASASRLAAALSQELQARGHPLARNAWKLEAAAGLAESAAERLLG